MQTTYQTIDIPTSVLITVSSIILWIAIVFVIYKCVRELNNPTKPKTETSTATAQYQYSLKQRIMTVYEQKIFLVLNDILNQKCYVIPQVHLSKLLNHKVEGQNWQGAFSHINGKSVDFVLLRKSTLEPLCAIELDDWTHKLQDRQERDKEVERMLQQAGLPLIRFEDIDKLSKQEIIDRIAQGIKAI